MIQALPRNLSFAEYLAYEDGTDTSYELIYGELVAMAQPTGQHADIADLNDALREYIKQRSLALSKQGAIAIQIPPVEGKDIARIPDVCIVTAEQWQMKSRSAAIALTEPPPLLVVEIVSTNWRDDYLKKLADYEALGIPEYWIVDYLALGASRYIGTPKLLTISVYQLSEGEYQVLQFRGTERIISATFPELMLTAEQVVV
ncbi:Uma2 family endonuclease [Gloeocapsopsis crepidinum LEGE 06123]|uniref:Uma2 family endonuclease n=1 Tax=Gloeocapsopsis crepidinum LEGE 06123 TaxID=588587 RepID=A0ABR9UXG9_9CHRO|nr:Uma2 family endonuclease [Gloeocapsopsis crepidinum]MBE9193006.1 Uma2 family endonuclease [Gloeocapsopsis crepidinum LEGE 06123]